VWQFDLENALRKPRVILLNHSKDASGCKVRKKISQNPRGLNTDVHEPFTEERILKRVLVSIFRIRKLCHGSKLKAIHCLKNHRHKVLKRKY
jgi:hypothetical protein